MTSLNQNFSDFANILMQRRQMQQQQAQQDRANRLADLQYNRMQREDDYQTGLQNAMQNPGVVTNTTIAPDAKPSLANLIPGSQLQAPQFQQPGPQVGPLASRVQTTTTPRSPAQAGAEYALLHNKPGDYKTYTDLNKAMLTQAAQAKIYGSPEQAAEIETELEKMTKGATLLSSWKKAGGIQFAKAQAAKMPQLFQGTNLDNMSATDAINTFNLPNGQQVVWSDDNPGQLHLSAAPPKQADVAHNVIEIPSANGKTAQKFQYNAKTERYDIPVGGAYAVKSQVPNINVNTGGGDNSDVDAWAKAVKEGRATLQDVPNRGTVRSRVVKAIESGGGVDYAAKSADNKAYAGSVAQQQKQLGSMGSFVKNLDAQIGRVGQVGAELSTFDSRLANIPLRAIRGKLAGSPLQSKYDMYLAEIESEIGKLSSGSTGSIAELSQGAREKWAKIIDPNLSINDMLKLLQEVKHAGELRMKSVSDQLDETRNTRKGSTGGKVRKIGKYAVEVH